MDYRLCNNPYLAKFGENEWENRIRKSPLLRKVLPVSDLIVHMANCTTEAMKGNQFEGKGLFFHDALSQLTEKETTRWMKNNMHEDGRTYYNMWITPVLGCNESFEVENGKKITCYAHRPVGNMPEAMCLDNSLNQDIHTRVQSNVGATYFLPDTDERKFSLTTPSWIIRAYKRVYCPTTQHSAIPSSRRIIQDISKVLYALKCIVEAKGNVVRGLASHKGHRDWVEHYSVEGRLGEDERNNNGDDNGEGDDDSNESKAWLHHDTKCALQEYWSKTDGEQDDMIEE